MDTLLEQRFVFPDLTDQRVLVLGLGGGCDVILAYAVARRLLPGGARSVIYANTKKEDEANLEPVTQHIRRLVGPVVSPSGRTHGTCAIDRSIPRGDEDCPWIVLLDDREADEALVTEIVSLRFDLIFGVDTGGDSLAARSSSGRDKRMLRVLEQTKIPLFLIVAAPGSDGDFLAGDLRRAMTQQKEAGRYRGCLGLSAALGVLRELSEPLTRTRTPNIILAAADDKLEKATGGQVIVPRGRRPAVPREWLLHAFVFGDEQRAR
jgi:hypothetical protein